MTRQHAIELARERAYTNPQQAYVKGCKREQWFPHDWVVNAIMEAYEQGRQFERMSFSAPPGQVVH